MKKKETPLLSVVVPAYNVAEFLDDTVKSVLRAKNSDLVEVIIVDDGSKDATSKIAKKLTKSHTNVRLITKENGGHGSTINVGIKEARGKYFRLLDGDDFFDSDSFDVYLGKLKKETSDLVLTDLVEYFVKSDTKRRVAYYETSMAANKHYNLVDVKFPTWGPMLPTTTIKTELLQKSGIKIDEGCYYVDQEYNFISVLMAKTVVYYPESIYYYRLEREGQSMSRASIMKNVYHHEKVCLWMIANYKKYWKQLGKVKRDYLVERVIVPLCHMQYEITTDYYNMGKPFRSYDKKLKKYPEFYNNRDIAGRIVRLHRLSMGATVGLDGVMKQGYHALKALYHKVRK